VIAFPNGALADLIDQGVTGFLVRDTDEMAEAITAADTLDPSNCQAAVRERFPAERTVKRYLELYSELVSTRRQVA
jgi:glycosyltransferase involved in cell wall biosynthesis